MKCSVLMSVYVKDNPEHLRKALNSVFNQSVPPAEVVLVKDGPLTNKLEKVIKEKAEIEDSLKVIALKQNVGMGMAWQIGMKECSYALIARMDSDDVCHQERFEKQINFLQMNPDIDAVGSNIGEFLDNELEIVSERILPQNNCEIITFAKKRNPINHMTVMFRRDSVMKVGGYVSDFPGLEDYFLWVRMLNSGMRLYNFQENLVFARIGNDMIGRRIGWNYVREDVKLFRRFVQIGFISKSEFIKIVPQRVIVRLLPKKILTIVYKKMLR